MQNILVMFCLIFVGVCLKISSKYIFPNISWLNYVSDLLITSLIISFAVGFYLQCQSGISLREILGIAPNHTLINSIHSILRQDPYITKNRISKWKFIDNGGEKIDIEHVEIHTIQVNKDSNEFYFRRGYGDHTLIVKDISIKRGGKFKRIDTSKEFNQHLLKQKHGSHVCNTLTNLDLKQNLSYCLKITTLFKECMSKERDYLSIDILNPTSNTASEVEFPFSLMDDKKKTYDIDVKIRSLTKFHGYIDYKIKDGSIKKNRLCINYNKPLMGGDSLVICYEKK